MVLTQNIDEIWGVQFLIVDLLIEYTGLFTIGFS